jgi:hypothetical protein
MCACALDTGVLVCVHACVRTGAMVICDSRALVFGSATFLSVKNGYQEMRKR